MQIDWLTVAAQILNFLVLIWLLQRFLYKPITQAMARREEEINARLASADKVRDETEAEAQALRFQRQSLDDRREEILQEAHRHASTLRLQLEQDIREEIGDKRKAWHQHLDAERDILQQSLQKDVARFVFQTVRQILSKFADTDLAAQVAAAFVTKLEALDKDNRQRLVAAAHRMQGNILVESGMELPSPSRGRITRAIHDILGDKPEVEYRIDETLLIGVRLILHDQNVEWSAGRYLGRLERQVNESLDAALAQELGEASP